MTFAMPAWRLGLVRRELTAWCRLACRPRRIGVVPPGVLQDAAFPLLQRLAHILARDRRPRCLEFARDPGLALHQLPVVEYAFDLLHAGVSIRFRPPGAARL